MQTVLQPAEVLPALAVKFVARYMLIIHSVICLREAASVPCTLFSFPEIIVTVHARSILMGVSESATHASALSGATQRRTGMRQPTPTHTLAFPGIALRLLHTDTHTHTHIHETETMAMLRTSTTDLHCLVYSEGCQCPPPTLTESTASSCFRYQLIRRRNTLLPLTHPRI